MTSPTPSTDSLSGATTLGSFVDSSDLGLGLDITHGCHGSSSSSSTCSSIVFPHLSISNGVLNHGFGNGIPSPTRGISIKCSLCHETYNKPKVLPCLHTFCQDCLEKAQDVGDRLICPSCRYECTLSSQGVAGLLPDFAVSNLLALQEFSSSSNSLNSLQDGLNNNNNNNNNNGIWNDELEAAKMMKGCTGCKSKDSSAVAKCIDCSNFLCSNCVMAHQFMHCFEGHRVINIPSATEQPGKENGLGMTLERQVSCTQHKGEKLQFYCRTCAVPACPECVATEHPKSLHETESLADCEGKYVKHLAQYIHDEKFSGVYGMRIREYNAVAQPDADGKVQFRMKSVALHDVLKSFETASARLQSHYSKAQNEVSEAFTFYRTLLDERKNELLKELENLYITRQVTLSVVTQRVQETLDRMYQTVEFGEHLLRHASPPQILVFKKFLETRLQTLLAGVPEPSLAMATAAAGDLEFVANYSAVQAAVRNTLGYIRAGVGNDALPQNKQPPAPIARPAVSQVNGYQVNQNGLSSLATALSGSSSNGSSQDSILLSKRLSGGEISSSTPYNQLDGIGQCSYEKWSIGSDTAYQNGHSKDFSCSSRSDFSSPPSTGTNNDPLLELTSKLMGPFSFPRSPSSSQTGQKMTDHHLHSLGHLLAREAVRFKFPTFGALSAGKRCPWAGVVPKLALDKTSNQVMRVIIFDQMGTVLHKFGCSKHLEFPNGVVVNDSQEIFISDNRAHCVKVFSYEGVFLRQIGGEGLTNYPIGVGINANGEILVADNHNNFNLTIFTQDGQLVSALESKVKHAQCFDVALMDDGSVVLASKDYRLYIYRYIQVPPIGL
ncbi:B-box type zinc finger protein ncl-1 [Orchesella cincta]|uniref:B-box type zinc finger protein ncl-1 n=1 Tax=Orchesella cincta TaxID=48709 RepID=A0A1D2MYR0_ORCCI|nr:B-box type zinc finger protein ncl-1 [Orchesella cincta]